MQAKEFKFAFGGTCKPLEVYDHSSDMIKAVFQGRSGG